MKILEYLRRGKSRLQKLASEFEVTTMLVYEKLEKHSSHCLMLDHKVASCPLIEQTRCHHNIFHAGSESVQGGSRRKTGEVTINSNNQILS